MFPGTITNLYYFENEGQMYGEYYPEIWKNAYGTIVNVSQSGTILQDQRCECAYGNKGKR